MRRCRSFRYRLHPTVRQDATLVEMLGFQRELYNAALEERRGVWRWEHRSVSYVEQCQTLTLLREARPEVLAAGVTVCRGTLRRLDWAFAGFYRRCRAGQRPGFPRFRSATRWESLQWEDRSGWRLDSNTRRLHLLGIGAIKVRLHRPLQGTPKAVTVRREGRRWWVTIRCVDVPAHPLAPSGRDVGIDLGVGVLVATSDGHPAHQRPSRAPRRRTARPSPAGRGPPPARLGASASSRRAPGRPSPSGAEPARRYPASGVAASRR